MSLFRGLVSGIAGASALTLLHETVRHIYPDAPRADVLGMRALAAGMRALDTQPPRDEVLHRWAMVSDLAANSLYYSFVAAGSGRQSWLRGVLLGGLAGVGAVVFPGPLGLGSRPTNRTHATQVLTVLWYLFGGLVAAAVAGRLRDSASR